VTQLLLSFHGPSWAAPTLDKLPVVVPSPAAAQAIGVPSLAGARVASLTHSETIAAVVKRSRPPMDPARYDPPAAVRSAIVTADAPYRPLPRAEGPPDGRFLTAPVPGYTASSEFEQGMAKAEIAFMAELVRLKAAGPVTATDMESLITMLAKQRREIEHARFPDQDVLHFARPSSAYNGLTCDYIYETADSRHHIYHPRAEQWVRSVEQAEQEDTAANGGNLARSRAQTIEIIVAGEKRTGAFAAPYRGRDENLQLDCIEIAHPTGEAAAAMRQRGYELLAEAANSTDFHIPWLALSEPEAATLLGSAHLLLMHATPMVRGSPSIVETAIDGILRVSYGVCLGEKKPGCEPFWEAMFTAVSQAEQYARQFRNFYC
jgi:hypothetical protein